MIINYDTEKINKLLSDFYNATGINMDLLRDDFSYISNRGRRENVPYCKNIQNTDTGKNACLSSDSRLLELCKKSKKTEIHICHAGLIDIAVPILYNNSIIGYIIFGQIKSYNDFSKIEGYISGLGLDIQQMKKNYGKIQFYNSEHIESVSNIASILVKHILLENMLKPDFDIRIESAVKYIQENLEDELNIQKISQNTNIAKTTLYELFRNYFNCTVGEYINTKRIEKSIILLRSSDLSIEEISQKSGFSGASYFGKIFKKHIGISPLKYKKTQKNKET